MCFETIALGRLQAPGQAASTNKVAGALQSLVAVGAFAQVPLSEDTKLHRFNLLAEQERAYEQAKQLQRPPQQPSAQDRDTDIGRDQGRHQSLRVTSKTPGWLLYDKKVRRRTST